MAHQKVPVTPSVLAWAVEDSGLGASEIATALEVPARQLAAWMTGDEQPSVTHFRKLATKLKRPSATLLLPAPPRATTPSVEFRHAPGREGRSLNPHERIRLREAARLQRGLRWILGELREPALKLPKFTVEDVAEAAARAIREHTGVSAAAQLSWKSESEAFREWRAAVERLGVAVLALPMGAESARGFSAWDDRVPVIAINTHWNPAARIFTLFHELGHLVSRTSSVCDDALTQRHKQSTDPVERWCESFASAVLLPPREVEQMLRRDFAWSAGEKISDLAAATRIARRFRVSVRAAVLRLINKGIADWTLYRAIPPASEAKPSGGGGGSGRSRAEARADEYGKRTAQVMFQGMQSEVVTRDDVLAYLNIGDRELADFQKEAGSL